MLKWIFAISLVALAVPFAALAEGSTPPTPAQTANQICKQEKTTLGDGFKSAYGTNATKSNAWGKCVSKNAKNARNDVANAAKTCQAQQADPNFAAAHDGKTFDQYYGGNVAKGKGSSQNAYGKCVSLAVQSAVAAQVKASRAALQTCRAARKSDAAGFAAKYGTGSDALGKCVAATSSSK